MQRRSLWWKIQRIKRLFRTAKQTCSVGIIEQEKKSRVPIDFRLMTFLNWIVRRIEKNRNAIIVFNGGTGSGKSYACLSCAYFLHLMLKSDFKVEENLDFSFYHLLEKMQAPGKDKKGTIFDMEEVGATGSGGSSTEWQTESNKFFFSFTQTSRCLNQVLLLNCPDFGYITKGVRHLVHFQLTSMGIDDVKKKSYFKPYLLRIDQRTGKMWFTYLRFTYKGKRYKLKRVGFPLPPKAWIEEYEELKKKYVHEHNQKILIKERRRIAKESGTLNNRKLEEYA